MDKFSRARWDQILKRVRQVNFEFDPTWKCLIDGKRYRDCYEHTETDNVNIIAQVKTRFQNQL